MKTATFLRQSRDQRERTQQFFSNLQEPASLQRLRRCSNDSVHDTNQCVELLGSLGEPLIGVLNKTVHPFREPVHLVREAVHPVREDHLRR